MLLLIWKEIAAQNLEEVLANRAELCSLHRRLLCSETQTPEIGFTSLNFKCLPYKSLHLCLATGEKEALLAHNLYGLLDICFRIMLILSWKCLFFLQGLLEESGQLTHQLLQCLYLSVQIAKASVTAHADSLGGPSTQQKHELRWKVSSQQPSFWERKTYWEKNRSACAPAHLPTDTGPTQASELPLATAHGFHYQH